MDSSNTTESKGVKRSAAAAATLPPVLAHKSVPTGNKQSQLPDYESILRVRTNEQSGEDRQAQLVKEALREEPPKKKRKQAPNPNRFYDPEFPVQPEIRIHTRRVEHVDTLIALEVLRGRHGSLGSADTYNRYAIIAATGRIVSASHLRRKVAEMGIVWQYR